MIFILLVALWTLLFVGLTESVSLNTGFDKSTVRNLKASTLYMEKASNDDFNNFKLDNGTTSYPTRAPTATWSPSPLPNCPDGYYYEFVRGVAVCHQCPVGSFAKSPARECTVSPKGYYVKPNSSEAIMCPVNTYSLTEGSTTCIQCRNSAVCPAGSFLASACVNPDVSFAGAAFGLLLSGIGISVYIVGGRLHRMAFIRREILVRKAAGLYNTLTIALMKLNDEYKAEAAARRRAKVLTICSIALRSFAFIMLIVFMAIIYFVVSVYGTFYTSLILYRGYANLPNFVKIASLVDRLMLYLEKLSQAIRIPYLMYVFYPFVYVVDFLVNLNIDWSAVQITCTGAQAPAQLFVDCVVVGITVVVIESDMEIFWSSSFANVHQELRHLVLRDTFWKEKPWRTAGFFLWSSYLQVIPHPRSVLQFGLGFFRVYSVFSTNYSRNCNIGRYYLVDQSLAIVSMTIAVLSILPMIYIFSQIIVPEFRLDKGLVKTTRAEARILAQADKVLCPYCELPLLREVSKPEKGYKCGFADDCRMKDALVPETVFYVCRCFSQCKYCLCRSCFHHEAKVNDDDASPMSYEDSLYGDDDTSDEIFESEGDDVKEGGGSGRSDLGDGRGAQEVLSVSSSIKSNDPLKKADDQDYYWKDRITSGAAFDWYYIRQTFTFVKHLNAHIYEKISDKDDESVVPVIAYTLPWFVSLSKEEAANAERIQLEWAKYSSLCPSYYRMILTVYDDLMPKLKYAQGYVMCNECDMKIVGKRYYNRYRQGFNLCEKCELLHNNPNEKLEASYITRWNFPIVIVQFCVMVLSATIVGQLISEKGRMIWYRVLLNYYVFIGACTGKWDQAQRRDFGIDRRVQRLMVEDAVVTHSNPRCPLLAEADEKQEIMQMVSALVSPRIVLIQMIPYATILSSLAVNLSQCPIRVEDSQMKQYLPPLFQTKLAENSRELLLDMGIKPQLWNIVLISLYLFVKRSRAIQFCYILVSFVISFSLVFAVNQTSVENIVSFSLIFYATFAVIEAFYPFVILLNVFFPSAGGTLTEEEIKTFARVSSSNKRDIVGGNSGNVSSRVDLEQGPLDSAEEGVIVPPGSELCESSSGVELGGVHSPIADTEAYSTCDSDLCVSPAELNASSTVPTCGENGNNPPNLANTPRNIETAVQNVSTVAECKENDTQESIFGLEEEKSGDSDDQVEETRPVVLRSPKRHIAAASSSDKEIRVFRPKSTAAAGTDVMPPSKADLELRDVERRSVFDLARQFARRQWSFNSEVDGDL